ncbi:MAG: DUF4377 domain-containing protein [Tannerellaceae bacterium]
MKTKLHNLVIIVVISIISVSCDRDIYDIDSAVKAEVKLTIGPNLTIITIEGNPSRDVEYMTVTDLNSNKTFAMHTNDIDLFEYIEGFQYELKALRIYLKNPPMDAPNPSYSLIEIISKIKQNN